MIQAVEEHILGRLQGIRFGDSAVTVYGPGPARPKGKTVYPCLALSRHLPPEVDMERARPYLDRFIPSDEEITIAIPYEPAYFEWYQGGPDIVFTGPESWTVVKLPTPLKLHYQLDLLATDDSHILSLMTMLFEALPMPYSAQIGDVWFDMLPTGSAENLDEIEKPLFRMGQRYEITNVWVDRLVRQPVPSIRRFDHEDQPTQ